MDNSLSLEQKIYLQSLAFNKLIDRYGIPRIKNFLIDFYYIECGGLLPYHLLDIDYEDLLITYEEKVYD